VSEFGGDGSGAGESGSFASPLPASVQPAIPAPRSPVTLVSKLAGIIALLSGLALTFYAVWSVLYVLIHPLEAVPLTVGLIAGIGFLLIAIFVFLAPQGPVTRLSKVAGIIILLPGLGLTAYGGWFMADPFGGPDLPSGLEGVLIGVGILVIGLCALLGGIGILRGAEWGRWIGIFCGVSFGLGSLAFIGDIEAHIVARGENFLLTLLLRLAFVMFTYSAIVLMFRWRRP